MNQDIELVEKSAVLLLGANEKPIPSLLHMQKELFIFSKFSPQLQDSFRFQKHYYGPYSQIVQLVLESPINFDNPFAFDDKRITLGNSGKKAFRQIIDSNKDNPKFPNILSVLKLIRTMYDKLTEDELLFLVYETYPEYIERSEIYSDLSKNVTRRNRILSSLLSKGLITIDRFKELKR